MESDLDGGKAANARGDGGRLLGFSRDFVPIFRFFPSAPYLSTSNAGGNSLPRLGEVGISCQRMRWRERLERHQHPSRSADISFRLFSAPLDAGEVGRFKALAERERDRVISGKYRGARGEGLAVMEGGCLLAVEISGPFFHLLLLFLL